MIHAGSCGLGYQEEMKKWRTLKIQIYLIQERVCEIILKKFILKD